MDKQFLFGFPIIKQTIDEGLYDKTKIVEDILFNYNLDENRNEWDSHKVHYGRPSSNLHHSHGDNSNNNFKKIDYSKLIPIYNEAITNALNQIYFKKKIKWNYSIENYTCIKKNNYMRDHIHLGCDFTAIHYLKFNNNEHFSTNFINTQKHSSYTNKLLPTLSGSLNGAAIENSWMSDNYSIDTDENDFIITPAIVEHSIPYHHNCDTHRITIALNIILE
jgi:hypothetical protein